jgi:hypothetical protein
MQRYYRDVLLILCVYISVSMHSTSFLTSMLGLGVEAMERFIAGSRGRIN